MFYHHVGAFAGVLIGGRIADVYAKRNRANRLAVQSIALLCGAPFIYLMAVGGSITIVYTALFVFGVFRGIYDSNIFASLYEVVKPEMRSSSSGLMLMCAFLVGAFSPLILGMLKPTLGMTKGLSYMSVSYVVGALLIFVAVRYYFKNDKE